MSRETTYKGVLGELQQLNAAMVANASELSHLQGSRIRLEEVVTQALATAGQQAALTASKQEATLRLRTLLAEGRQVANILRLGIQHHYGKRSEKLCEFGLQPFRGLKQAVEAPEPEPVLTPVADTAAAAEAGTGL